MHVGRALFVGLDAELDAELPSHQPHLRVP
jgi:hypothetical protein